MKVYTDVVNGEQLLSDGFPIKEDGLCYVVEGKYVTRTGAVSMSGAAGADDTDDAGPAPAAVLNVADTHRLVATSYDKRSYAGQVKGYLKKVLEQLPADERSALQQQAKEWVTKVLADFDSYQFLTGENMDPEAMVVLLKTGEDGKTPFLYYIRHGLKAEVY